MNSKGVVEAAVFGDQAEQPERQGDGEVVEGGEGAEGEAEGEGEVLLVGGERAVGEDREPEEAGGREGGAEAESELEWSV